MKYIRIIIIIFLTINLSNIFAENNELTEFFEKNNFIIVGDSVNVRSEPNINSTVLIQLKITKVVKILKKSNIKFNNNGISGEWVFIDTGIAKDIIRDENFRGWVLDYYLAKDYQFKKVHKFYDCKLEGYSGDYHIQFEFKENGTYKQIYKPHSSKNTGYYIGSIYRFRDVIIIKNNGGVDYFFIKDNMLCHSSATNVCTQLK